MAQSRGSKFFKRRFRAARRSAARISKRSIGHTRNYLFGRREHLRDVQRRVMLWTVLVFILIGSAALQIVANRASLTQVAAASGGTYVEGAIGPFETLNPILATTGSELAASRLLFSGLFDYDQTGSIRPALAVSIDTTDTKTYIIHLRDGVKWSDGTPFTSADVVYTIGLIQNAAVRSPLASSFRNITVTATDSKTVRMVLPSGYAPFVHSLTFGILPAHVLAKTDPVDIRSSSFNRNPVTIGPFTFGGFREQDANGNPVLYLNKSVSYYRPVSQVDRFQLHVYKDQTALLRAYERREIGAIAGASENTATSAQNARARTKVTNVPLDNGDYALFNTKNDLYSDANLRATIRQGTDLAALRRLVGGGVGELDGPVLAGQVPEVATLKQVSGDPAAAKTVLDSMGWVAGTNGIRVKDGRPLTMRLVAIDSGDYPRVARELEKQWKALGIDVQLNLQPSDTASEQVLVPRAFDVLIYELAIGADPDVYAYWHSSQTGQGGLNFSGYNSGIADDNLSSSRGTLDTQLRNAKYVAFARQWLADTPAIALFQQSYHYVSGDDIMAMPTASTLVTPVDRYATVNNWTVDVRRVFSTP